MPKFSALSAAVLPVLAILLAGCNATVPASSDASSKRLAALEKEVALLKERDRDVRAKIRVSHGWGNSPVQDFLANPDFWECTYDTGWSDCATRCSTQTSRGYQACLQRPEGPERQRCVEENSNRGAACLRACPAPSAPTTPGC